MDDSKNTKKSSQGARKRMGDKLKNETSRGEAMRKKLRHGKKDNRMTQEEKKELSKLRAQGRKKAYKQVAVLAEARKADEAFALPHHKRPRSKKYLQSYLEYLCRHKKNDAA